MTEIWKPVERESLLNRDGTWRYEVSNTGFVRNAVTHRLLTIADKGHVVVTCTNDVTTTIPVGVLVANAFICKPHGCNFVRHLDGCVIHNCVDNLEWSCARSTSRSKSVRQYTLDGEFIKEFVTVALAARETGVTYNQIARCCKKEYTSGIVGDFIWRYSDDIEVIEDRVCLPELVQISPVSIRQYTPEGEFIAEYSSFSEIEKVLGVRSLNIRHVCDRKPAYNSALGYIWRYENDDEIARGVVPDIPISGPRAVKQYTLNGEFLNEYESVFAAASAVDAMVRDISSCCKLLPTFSSVKGFIWRYSDSVVDGDIDVAIQSGVFAERYYRRLVELGLVPDVRGGLHRETDLGGVEGTKYKPIRAYTLDLCYLGEFESASEASRVLNCRSTGISSCCLRSQVFYLGILWRFKGDDELFSRCTGYPKQDISRLIEMCKTNYRGTMRMRKIYQYTLYGKLVAEFDSYAELCAKTGYNRNNIHRVIYSGRPAYGYLWCPSDCAVKPIGEEFGRGIPKPIEQYALDGSLVATYKTFGEAISKSGVSRYHIEKCLDKIPGYESVKGYVFKRAVSQS